MFYARYRFVHSHAGREAHWLQEWKLLRHLMVTREEESLNMLQHLSSFPPTLKITDICTSRTALPCCLFLAPQLQGPD